MPSLGPAEAAAVRKAIDDGFVGPGVATRTLEEAFAARHAHAFGFAVASGTLALELALRAVGAGPGGLVLVPVLVCAAVPQAVLNAGAMPIPVDLVPDTLAMSPAECARLIGELRASGARVDAIVAVHPFGQACDIQALLSLGIPVVEDCAGSLGCLLGGRPVGSFAPVSIFSLGSTKMITAGAGGILLTSDPELSNRVERMLAYDSDEPMAMEFRTNARLSSLNAALGSMQLSRLDEFVAARQAIARLYDKAIAALPGLRPVAGMPECSPSWYRYVVIGDHAEAIALRLHAQGIHASTRIAACLEAPPAVPSAKYPAARRLEGRILSLPIYPALGAEAGKVAEALGSAIGELRE